jgi:hypothetical protein
MEDNDENNQPGRAPVGLPGGHDCAICGESFDTTAKLVTHKRKSHQTSVKVLPNQNDNINTLTHTG